VRPPGYPISATTGALSGQVQFTRQVLGVDRRGIGTAGRTGERDRGPRAAPQPTWFLGRFARLGENRAAENRAEFLYQRFQIAGGRDGEADLAQMRFAIAVHREIRPLAGSQCRHQIEDAVFRRVVQTADELLGNTDVVFPHRVCEADHVQPLSTRDSIRAITVKIFTRKRVGAPDDVPTPARTYGNARA
jgi:hypothetical protein